MAPDATWPLAPLPWQAAVWSRIQALLSAERLPHALLLAGPEGIGKAHLAQALAARMLCEQPAAGTACGNCRGCSFLQAGSHADLLIVGVAEDTRVIKIEQIRKLIEFAGKTPSLGARKVILLGPAEAMNTNSANALLKSLEEPSASTTLLLYSHQAASLPATVRSRCQTLSLGVPPEADSLAWLDAVTGSVDESRQLLQVSAGRPVRARDLFYSDDLATHIGIHQGLAALLEGKLSALEFPQLVSGIDIAAVLDLLRGAMETYLRRQTLAGAGSEVRAGFLFCDELARQQRAISHGANPNRQLIIEDCTAQLAQIVGAIRT